MDYEAPIAFAHFSDQWCSGRKSRLSGRLEDFKSILAEMLQENVLEGFTVEGSAEPEDLLPCPVPEASWHWTCPCTHTLRRQLKLPLRPRRLDHGASWRRRNRRH
jgi:hypothetical protein